VIRVNQLLKILSDIFQVDQVVRFMHTQEDLNTHFETQLESLETRFTAEIDGNPLF